MDWSKLDLAYRLRRRLLRELRQRAGGLDFVWDCQVYRRTQAKRDSQARFLAWGTLAPWENAIRCAFLKGNWANQEEVEALVTAADRACAHEFVLLGSGNIKLDPPIDWHRDFKSGYRWDPQLHHSRIRWDNLPAGADIKVPWELSRCMHFTALGLADCITDDARYHAEWKRQLRDWIADNPVGRGVNWSCAMDVGMRAVNWLKAAMLFRHRIEADGDCLFFQSLAESLWHHGLHIERNLEWSGPNGRVAGNHFLANLTGLLAIGAFFKDTRKGNDWWRFAKHWIEHEIFRQVNPDGTNYETSTSYHRMVMEMFLWSDTLATRMGEPFTRTYQRRLDLMADFVTAYSAPGGRAAQFGDNDSGRLLWAGLDDGTDHRYLTKGECGYGGRLNRLLLRGEMEMPGNDRLGITSYPDGGFYFMRQGPAWIGLRAGAVSHGGAHAHCDQLSFVFNLAGKDIIADRGTGVYTPDTAKRNRYRATASHSVVQINGWEQNGFGLEWAQVFQMPDHTKARMIRRMENATESEWEAEHRGFERNRVGLRCFRKIRMSSDRLEIEDSFHTLQADDRLTWYFHFAPGVVCEHDGQKLRLAADGIELQLAWIFPTDSTIEPVSHSPAYGVEIPASTLRVTTVAGTVIDRYRFMFDWHSGR